MFKHRTERDSCFHLLVGVRNSNIEGETFTEVVLLNHRDIVIITAMRLFTIISAFWQTNYYIPRFYVTILLFRERTLFRFCRKSVASLTADYRRTLQDIEKNWIIGYVRHLELCSGPNFITIRQTVTEKLVSKHKKSCTFLFYCQNIWKQLSWKSRDTRRKSYMRARCLM